MAISEVEELFGYRITIHKNKSEKKTGSIYQKSARQGNCKDASGCYCGYWIEESTGRLFFEPNTKTLLDLYSQFYLELSLRMK